jgi:hypothetical protein
MGPDPLPDSLGELVGVGDWSPAQDRSLEEHDPERRIELLPASQVSRSEAVLYPVLHHREPEGGERQNRDDQKSDHAITDPVPHAAGCEGVDQHSTQQSSQSASRSGLQHGKPDQGAEKSGAE